MQAGKLRWRIRIDQQTTSPNSMGEEIVGWETFADDVPAAILSQSGRQSFREYFSAEHIQNEQLVEINIRFMPGIKEGMRVVRLVTELSPPEPLEPLSIEGTFADNATGTKWLTLMCRKRLNPGIWGADL